MAVVEMLQWRYATKQMNGAAVPEEKLDKILEAIRLSASSLGVQPYTVLNVSDKDLREKLKGAAYGQPQLTQASNVLVFAAWRKLEEQNVDSYLNDVAETRGMKLEELSGYRDMIMGVANRPGEHTEWAARQAYIALGTALIAAAEQEVDATPMEGFDPDQVDEILGLSEKGMRSVLLLPLGFRDAEKDQLSKAPKVRRKKGELILNY